MTAYAHLLLAASLAGILQGVRWRQFIITSGIKAKLARILARKPAGRLHWNVIQKLAGACAR